MPGGGRRRCQVSWCPQQPLVTAISALKQRSPTPGLHTSTGRGLSEPAAQQEVSSWREQSLICTCSGSPASAPSQVIGVRCSSEHWSLLPQRVGTAALKDTRPGGAFNIPGRSRLGLFQKLSEAPAAVGATPHCRLVPSARLQLPFPPADSPASHGVPKDEDRRCLAFPSAWEEIQLPPSPTGLRSDVPFTPGVTLGGSVSPATTCPFDSRPLPPALWALRF